MLTSTYQIKIKPGCESRALETLAAIQRAAHRDEGCVNFVWLRQKEAPSCFMLFEQWESQAALDASRSKGADFWEAFVPCLAGAPSATEYELVTALLGTGLSDAAITAFAREWFDKLSRHVPVEELLPLLSDVGPRMQFPERTITNREEFRDWYAGVGDAYSQQSHDIERLEVRRSSTATEVDVVVVWNATRRADLTRLSMRATQTWTIGNTGPRGAPVIIEYIVKTMENIA